MLGAPKQRRLPPSLDRQLVVLYQRLEQVEAFIKLFLFSDRGKQVESLDNDQTFPNLFVNPGAMVIVVPTAKGWSVG